MPAQAQPIHHSISHVGGQRMAVFLVSAKKDVPGWLPSLPKYVTTHDHPLVGSLRASLGVLIEKEAARNDSFPRARRCRAGRASASSNRAGAPTELGVEDFFPNRAGCDRGLVSNLPQLPQPCRRSFQCFSPSLRQ